MIGLIAWESVGRAYLWEYGNSSYSNWCTDGSQVFHNSSHIKAWGRNDCVAMMSWPEFGKWVGTRCYLEVYAYNLGYICEASKSASAPPTQVPSLVLPVADGMSAQTGS